MYAPLALQLGSRQRPCPLPALQSSMCRPFEALTELMAGNHVSTCPVADREQECGGLTHPSVKWPGLPGCIQAGHNPLPLILLRQLLLVPAAAAAPGCTRGLAPPCKAMARNQQEGMGGGGWGLGEEWCTVNSPTAACM
jgi:hypothetical protein